MTRVQKNRVYAALIVLSFVMGFVVDSPVEFLLYLAFAVSVASAVIYAPLKPSRRSARV